jgi:DNA-binding response OmpR family regulator
MLRNWGYQVITASSGTEAWELLQRPGAPHMAILDWMMPGLSGPEVCALVRQKQDEAKSSYTYIILLTSRHEREDLIAGMEAGADDYLVKPFDSNELKVRLGPGRRIIQLQTQLLSSPARRADGAIESARDMGDPYTRNLARPARRDSRWSRLGRPRPLQGDQRYDGPYGG